ncbi:MAG: hypothetical protein K0U16_07290 [Gammaproteobacteria bacterium]|nr:hypothetical protein [Gammaproteobacteria bacterium]
MEIEDPNLYYALGVGTPDERTVPFLKIAKLGEAHDDVYTRLKEMMDQTFDNRLQFEPPEVQQAAMGQRTLTQAIMLVWCYAARDNEKLREENKALRSQLDEIQRSLSALSNAVMSGDEVLR